MKSYDPQRPVIFAHIPKCAGTSFIRLLRRWYRDGYHHPHVNEKEQGTQLPRVSLRDEQGNWRNDIQCIHAHFDHGRGYGLPHQFPDVDQYFSFMRDPFDIVVSMYFFAKRKSAEGTFFYDGKQVDIRDNYPSVADYVRDEPKWLYHHLPQDITLENYLEEIPKRFVYLGLFEDMDNSLKALARVLNKPYQPLPQVNVSTYDEDIPQDLREWFYEKHPLLKGYHDIARRTYLEPLDGLSSNDSHSESGRSQSDSRATGLWQRLLRPSNWTSSRSKVT